jgi:hypothetical protein
MSIEYGEDTSGIEGYDWGRIEIPSLELFDSDAPVKIPKKQFWNNKQGSFNPCSIYSSVKSNHIKI